MATSKEKQIGLDYWAEAFLATTWEELKGLAGKGKVFREMAEAMYTVNADISQRSIAEAHRKFVETHLTYEHRVERMKKKKEEAEAKAREAETKAKAKVKEAETKAEAKVKEAENKANEALKREAEAMKRVKELEAKLASITQSP